MKIFSQRWMECSMAIAVFAFALALLLPMTSTARSGGKSALCLANLHLLGKAWLAYQEDNDGKLVNGMVPRDQFYAYLYQWLAMGFKDNAWWVNPPHNAQGYYSGDLIPISLQDEDNGIRSGKLFPYVGTSAAYHCPSDLSYLKPIHRGGKRSYLITGLMHGEDAHNINRADTYSQIVRPARKYFLVENSEDRGWNMGSWIMNWQGSQPGWIDPFAINHNRSSGISFADGHGEIHPWFDQSTMDMAANQTAVAPVNWAAGEGRDVLYMASGYVPVN
jgi:hypothetical protein